MIRNYPDIGLHVPEILVPAPRIDLDAWATIACDQYTSQPDYWEKVERLIADKPSSYRLMLPEAYLACHDVDQRIARIHAAMRQYVADGTLRALPPGFILVERFTPQRRRLGLLAALDLEQYDCRPDSQSLIRPTEATVPERLPPRVRIRRGAILEMPHILVLIDDPEDTVIGPLYRRCQHMDLLYDFALMFGAGRLRGWHIGQEDAIASVVAALRSLASPVVFRRRYGLAEGENKGILLFAIGDGNHSLAAAKAVWEETKSTLAPSAVASHPARYALVELVNLHDPGLHVAPIHRVMFSVNGDEVLAYFAKQGVKIGDEAVAEPPQRVGWRFVSANRRGAVVWEEGGFPLAVSALDSLIAGYLAGGSRAKIDYLHGDDIAGELGSRPGNMAFLLPALQRDELYPFVIRHGCLPRKAFSLGEAEEKRFYLECRLCTLPSSRFAATPVCM